MTTPKPYYLRPNAEQQELNEFMKKLIPELDSEYAVTPMERGKWRMPEESSDDGTPCYIAALKPTGTMPDYIWMPKRKDLPAGYYHFYTQEAYIEVYHRLNKLGPLKQLLFTKDHPIQTKQDRKLHKKLKGLMYNRLITDVPSDVHAARMKVLNLQSQGGKAAAFGRAAYLPTLTTVILLG
ncbi:expressed unknown protein [Seminavis robusta]|uniref:Uncharacterized protein n=1 Tax=Seminavis robusta TaxID=568900 RepID=A0A9N8DW95_9STRA|nr:expressed unknown protein [Seminavis robusta]|eukprot:Sro405_g136260.1 n/a (181) ;mRNA; r:58758-59300